MLIQVVPNSPNPTVLFAIEFNNLLDHLPIPLAWAHQLHCLSLDDLVPPKCIHSLDKAAAVACLVQKLTFDIPALTVSCSFIDGLVEEWPLMGTECLRALEGVVDDVNGSSVEVEREKEREKVEQERQRKRIESLNSPPSSVKITRHKKQRSLLMSLVASIVPLSSFTSSAASLPPREPSPPPTPVTSISPSLWSSRALRRRARSTLVDTFRQYALREITRRLPPGGYYTWIIHSTLRQVADRMSELVMQAGGQFPDPRRLDPQEVDRFAITAPSMPPSPLGSDEDDNDTDTDGSSVHTPTSSRFNSIRHSRHSREPTLVCSEWNDDDFVPPKEPQHPLSSPQDFAEYSELSVLMQRLNHLVMVANSRLAHIENETRHREDVLEVRSRRRAWLNKALSNSGSSGLDMGFALPFKSSPLGRYSWSSDDFEYVPDEVEIPFIQGQEFTPDFDERIGRRIRRMRPSIDARLFPVTEEDEDEALNARDLEIELGLNLDLDTGHRWPSEANDEDRGIRRSPGGLRVTFDLEKPQIRPRVRTSSMYRQQLTAQIPIRDVEIGLVPRPPSPPRPRQRLTPNSLLCQSFPTPVSSISSRTRDLDIQLGQPPAYIEEDCMVGDLEDEEFTLSMDLPSRRTSPEAAVRKRPGLRRHGDVSALLPDRMDGWVTSGLPDDGVLQCR